SKRPHKHLTVVEREQRRPSAQLLSAGRAECSPAERLDRLSPKGSSRVRKPDRREGSDYAKSRKNPRLLSPGCPTRSARSRKRLNSSHEVSGASTHARHAARLRASGPVVSPSM